ncbi:hypothetical protein [Pseudonocardia humida]|uniref:Uncharacterized protein n=1 Tax=Pseudonocardia humida TaxID=2800819 RepID=A0ABT0ZXR8_9PSEU|nr:hypothetical protein [Pseudonocardia humida]MCO1655537.1 hypothetical protein [Pseudonocardia humida]
MTEPTEPSRPDSGAIFRAFAALLSGDPPTWRRLIQEHVPTESGHCAAPLCGRPGYGTPDYVPHPCGARAVADAARELHR